jgi:hypothetical protein
MHAKNSNPPIPLFSAKSESFLSRQALPAIMTSFGNIEILEKIFPSLITTPLNFSSLIRVFEPAPKICIFSFSPNFLKTKLSQVNYLV